MTAGEKRQTVPQELRHCFDAGYADWESCTGQDSTCHCSWHEEQRKRDPDDPTGPMNRRAEAEAVEWHRRERALLVRQLARTADPECQTLLRRWLED
jgi:hypothetical protein